MKTIVAAAIVAIASLTSANAQWQPSGPIKVLLGFQAGGGLDTIARMMAEDLSKEYGWTIIPENAAGAGGTLLARKIRDVPADGLTLGIGPSSTFSYNMLATRNAGYKIEDFDFISTIAGTQMGVVAKANRGWSNLSDVIAAAKSGEKISFGAPTQQLADAAFYIGKVNDVEFNIVSNFKGGKAVLNAITADDIDIGWVGGIQKKGVESGELLNLVNAEKQPLAVSPDAQTLKDVGVDLFFGGTVILFAPDGLPEEARTAIIGGIENIMQKPGTKLSKFITETGVFTKRLNTGDDAHAFINQELLESKKLLEASSN